jgi:N-acyl-D-aspartate/D-glutamate deacylase
VLALAELLGPATAIYTTHLRTEAATILDAMSEAFEIVCMSDVPVAISHLKCAGIDN